MNKKLFRIARFAQIIDINNKPKNIGVVKYLSVLLMMLIFVVIFTGSVLAVGITPGRTTLDYSPGSTEQISFKVINTDKTDSQFVVLVQGELNASISVSEVSFTMAASEESKDLFYNFNMPVDLGPGQHAAEIVVIQLPKGSGGGQNFIGAAVGVATQLHVFVPYPGKYAESDLNVFGPENNKMTFVMPVISRGDLDLVRVRANVDIYTSLNEKVTTLATQEIPVKSGERKELAVDWDVSNTQPGPYRAVATILYDEKVLQVEKSFGVGEKRLEIDTIEVNDFSLGEIAKFEVLVENKWNVVAEGAYMQMLVYNTDGAVMADFKSPTYDIPPLSKELLVSFWDTGGVRKGTYDSSLFLKYGSSSQQEDFKLEVSDNNINVIGVGYVISRDSGGGILDGSLTIILGTAIAVLIIINLLWFLYLRKKLKKK